MTALAAVRSRVATLPPLSFGRPIPVHPLLFGAYAVLYLYAANVAEVAPEDALGPLIVVVSAVVALLAVATLVLRDARRAALVVSPLVVAFFGYGHVARAIAPLHIPGRFQFLAWVALVALAGVAAVRLGSRIGTVTRGLNVAAAALVIISLITIVPYEFTGAVKGTASGTPPPVSAGSGEGTKRDIYYLVFDRYGSDWALRYHFGYENNDLPPFLEQQGFFVAKQSHANYATTSMSLASSMHMKYLDELTARYGRDTADYSPVFQMLRDHTVGRFLQSQGYHYYHTGSWWGPTQLNNIANTVYRWQPDSEFASVLRDTTMLPYVARKLGLSTALTFRERAYGWARFGFQKLRDVQGLPGPKFVFAHILLPHPPYMFHADGSFIPDDEARRTGLNALFRQQITYTNSQIRSVVARLLNGPEASRPIVIIQADEGPKPLRSDVDWTGKGTQQQQVRFGILNAYYFPGLRDTGLYPSITPVNSFRLLFSKYFGADLPLLPDRSYGWPPARIFDFRDITNLLKVKVPDSERAWTPVGGAGAQASAPP